MRINTSSTQNLQKENDKESQTNEPETVEEAIDMYKEELTKMVLQDLNSGIRVLTDEEKLA